MPRSSAVRTWSLGALLGTMSGCAWGANPPPDITLSAHGSIRLVQPARSYQLHTLRSPNDEAALNAGEIHVFLQDGSQPPPGRLLTVLPGTSRGLTIQHLRRDHTYSVLLKAYKPDPEAPDQWLLMSDDDDSTVSFNTLPTQGAYSTRQEITFRLRLSDQIFSGVASGTLNLTGGDVLDTLQPEALVR
jgi:hypothetical protein